MSEWVGHGIALALGIGIGVYVETMARQWYDRTKGGTKG